MNWTHPSPVVEFGVDIIIVRAKWHPRFQDFIEISAFLWDFKISQRFQDLTQDLTQILQDLTQISNFKISRFH